MAKDTLGVVIPFSMASHALAVIGALESRLPEAYGTGRLVAMAFTTGGDPCGRTVMVACSATFAQANHLRVKLVVKADRFVQIP